MADKRIPPPFKNDPSFLGQIEDKLEPHRRFPYVHLTLLDVPLPEGVSIPKQRRKRRSKTRREDYSDISCHICGLQLAQNFHLIRHITTIHTEVDKPFRCSICNQSFKKYPDLKSHLVTAHPKKSRAKYRYSTDEAKLKYSCHLCSRRFISQAFVFHHLKTHPEAKNRFVCPVCGQSFAEYLPLKSHLVTQHPDQYKLSARSLRSRSDSDSTRSGNPKKTPLEVIHLSYQCTKCPKRFAWQSYLDRHVISHQTDNFQVRQKVDDEMAPPSFCDLCNLSFKAEGGLRQHKLYFHGTSREVKCTDCGKVLTALEGLLYHKRIHELEKVSVSRDIQPHLQYVEVPMLITVTDPLNMEGRTTKLPLILRPPVAKPQSDPLATGIMSTSIADLSKPRNDVTDLAYPSEDPILSWVRSVTADPLAVVSQEVAVLPTVFPTTVLKMET